MLAPIAQLVEQIPLKDKVVGSIPTGRTSKEIASFEGSSRFARRPNRTDFSGQKEIPDSVRSRKEKFS